MWLELRFEQINIEKSSIFGTVHIGRFLSLYLVLVVEPVDLHLHPPPAGLPEVHYLAQVGQSRPELTEEHSVVSHLQTLHPVTDLRILIFRN